MSAELAAQRLRRAREMHAPLSLAAIQDDVAVAHILFPRHRNPIDGQLEEGRRVSSTRPMPRRKLLCVAYAVDDGPVQLWLPGRSGAAGIIEAAARSKLARVCAQRSVSKAPSSSTCWRRGTAGRSSRSSATAAPWRMCLALGLPARLSAVADALELANRKDAAGERLMHQMSKPRKPRQGEDPAGCYWFDDDDRLAAALRLLPARRRGRARAVLPAAAAVGCGTGAVGAQQPDQRARLSCRSAIC